MSMIQTQITSQKEVLAGDRWIVEKKKRELDHDLETFHEEQLAKLQSMRTVANKHAVDIFEKILFKMRWAVVKLPIPYQRLIVAYCSHLLGDNPLLPFVEMSFIKVSILKNF